MKKHINVLMVEDNEDDAELLKRMLKKSDYVAKCHRVETEEAFVAALDEQAWDLILCDYRLPGFSGIAALSICKKRELDIPFIFVSGTMGEEVAVDAMTKGAHDYVMKNNMARLLPAIDRELKEATVRVERRQAIESLKASEEKFRRVVETALEGVWFLDSEFKTTEVNDAIVNMLGYTREELIGKPFIDLVFDEDRPLQAQEFQQRRRGVSGQYERRLLSKDGSMKWVFLSAKAAMSAQGAFLGTFAMITDITERKRSEARLSASEAYYRTLTEASPDALVIVDLNGVLEFATPKAVAMFGVPPEKSTIGTSIFTWISPHDHEMVKTRFQEIASGRWLPGPREVRLLKDDRTPFWGEINSSTIVDDGGKTVGLLVVCRDISERKQAEEALQKSEEKYRVLSESSPEMIYLIGRDGRISYLNSAAAVQFHAKPSDIVGRHLTEIFPTGLAEQNLEGLRKVLDSKQASMRELVQSFPVGDKWIEARLSPVIDDKGDVSAVLGLSTDITERKRSEEALRESEERYRTLIAHSPDAIYVHVDGRVTMVNPALCGLLRATDPSELIGKSVFDIVDPKYHEKVRERWDLVFGGQNAPPLEEEFTRLDGTLVDVEVNAVAIDWKGSKGVQVIARDITGRKLAEERSIQAAEALRQSEARYRAVLQSANDAIVTADSDGNITGWNKGAERVFGYSYVDVIGQPLTNLMPRDYRLEHINGIKRFQSSRTPRLVGNTVDVKGMRKDGSEFPIELSLASWEVSEGQFYTAIIRDVTERRRAEEALARERYLLEMMMKNVPDHIYFKDLESRFIRNSVSQIKRFGLSDPSQALGKTDFDFFSQEHAQRAFEDEQTIMRTGQPIIGVEEKETWPDGRVTWASTTKMPLRDKDGAVVGTFGVSRDVTEHKKNEAAVRESELRFRSVWEHSADGMRLTDSHGNTIDVNDAFCKLVKITREQLVGNVFSRIYKSHGPSEGIEVYHQRFASGAIVPRLAATITLWNDEQLDVEISNSFIDVLAGEKHLLSVFRDVTQRNEAERRLERERTLLRTIIDAIPDEIAVKDTERRFIVVNEGTVKALKCSSEDEIIGKQDEDFIPDHLLKEAKWEENAVLAVGGHSRNRVADKVHPETGEIERSLLISKIPLKDNEGKIIGVVGINRDITDLKRIEEMLQKERTLLLTLIESIPDEVCLKDLRHRYVVANRASVKALGAASLEAMIGKTDRDFVPTEYVDLHFAEEDSIVASGEPVINREQTKINPDTGEIEKCVLTTKVPVRDHTGKTIGILVVNRDITGRKKAEEGLRGSEEKFRALFEESKDCIYISSADGKVMDINAAGIDMFGYDSKEELLRRDFGSDLYDNRQQRAEFLSRMNQQGFVKDFEVVMKRKDKQKLMVLETAVAVRDRQGKMVMIRGTIRDVTRQKLLERQVGQAQKMESLGLLAGGIAHDFNNILGIILGHTAVIERAGNNPELLKDSINEITTAVQRGASLVRQILTFARKSDAADEPIRVNATVKELAKMIDDTFPKTVSVSLSLDKTLPIIMMDQTQLHQALLNLCVNARDAITDSSTGNLGRGEIRIQTSVIGNKVVRKQFSEASAPEYVCIAVSDSGKGMDEETKQKIFEPFFTTKERGKGTGLGLSVVYGIIKGHHGHIEVESTIGQGTTFRLYLPVTEALATLAVIPEDATPTDIRGKETILLVEDEQNLLGLMKTALERAGYTVMTAMDGLSAIKVYSLNKEKIALVLTDLGLPKLDGAAVFTSLMDIDPNVKIILASGYLDPNLKSNLLRSGAKEFIQKPYNPNLVLRKIREVLDAAS